VIPVFTKWVILDEAGPSHICPDLGSKEILDSLYDVTGCSGLGLWYPLNCGTNSLNPDTSITTRGGSVTATVLCACPPPLNKVFLFERKLMYGVVQFGDSLYLMVMTDSDPNWRPIAMFVADAPEEVRERALEMCAILNGDLDADAGIEIVKEKCTEEHVDEPRLDEQPWAPASETPDA
jgi:hypothetical protein